MTVGRAPTRVTIACLTRPERTAGEFITAPFGIGNELRVGQDIIISEVIYDFEPIMFAEMTDKQLYHVSFHRPRLGPLTELTPDPSP